MFEQVTLQLFIGFWETIKIFFLTLLFSLPLGVVICLGSKSSFLPLRVCTRGLIWVIRGTPLMLQLIVLFYGPGILLRSIGIELNALDRFWTVVAAFSLNYACYFSEIYRGGIDSIPVGQWEAGQVLGMSKTQVFFRVVLLQVVKRIVAPMSNEWMTLVKDTALARVLAVYEVTYMGQSFIKKGFIWPLLYTGIFYLLFNGLLTVLFSKLEKKLEYFRG